MPAVKLLRSVALLTLLTVAGFVSAKSGFAENTLGANGTIPHSMIAEELEPLAADALLNSPYMAFYQVNGKVDGNMMRFSKLNTRESFPDDRLAYAAKSIAGMADRAVNNTGSRIKEKATAYVAFYEGRVPGISPEHIMVLTTSAQKAPNVMAVLIVKDNNSASKKGSRTVSNTSGPEGSGVYLFELAL